MNGRPAAAWEPTLDDPTAPDREPAADRSRDRADDPGLRTRIGATRDAARRLVEAHIELGKAELSDIGRQIGIAVGLVGCAVALLVLTGFFLIVGLALFLGEWLFGSLGWGVLHGSLFFPAVALTAGVAALGIEAGRIARVLLGALAIGIVAAVIFGLALPNAAYAELGRAIAPDTEPGPRPLVVGVSIWAVAFAGAFAVVARRGGIRMILAALVAGAVLGAVVGAFTAIGFSIHVGVAVAVTIAIIAWIALLGADMARTGIDAEALKARFMPTQTIDTTKETLEWLKERMPPGIGS
jgi:hypothetical protein